METLTKTIEGQEKRIKELETEQDKLLEKLHDERNESNNGFRGKENDFFNVNGQNTSNNQYFRKTRHV